jgi:hypothetical protein
MDDSVSNFAYNFILRRYTAAPGQRSLHNLYTGEYAQGAKVDGPDTSMQCKVFGAPGGALQVHPGARVWVGGLGFRGPGGHPNPPT